VFLNSLFSLFNNEIATADMQSGLNPTSL